MSEPARHPTDESRLGELIGKIEAGTTDGDFRDLTQDDFGDIYSWLMWSRESGYGKPKLCECGAPENSIRHSNAAASSIDAHAFKGAK